MSLDARSRERLAALGRTLPQPLPAPEPVRSARAEASTPRHAVETEENPEQLFRELMAASADGSVPPHLLDRLRQLEKERQRSRTAAASRPISAVATPAAGPTASAPSASGRRRQGTGQTPARSGRAPVPGSEEAELYTAFAQLLLEDEELD